MSKKRKLTPEERAHLAASEARTRFIRARLRERVARDHGIPPDRVDDYFRELEAKLLSRAEARLSS